VCFNGIVDRFLKGASITFGAGITDIRWLESCNAYLFFKVGAIVVTAIAHLAIFQRLTSTTPTAHVDFGATVPMHTSVVTVCSIAGAFNNRVFSDFSGNGGAVFSEFFCDLAKRFSVEKTVFHFHSFFVCDIIRHGIDLL
jgi:hypothetical protein